MQIHTDICLVGGVTVISYYQMATFARRLWQAREKFKIYPPQTDGPEEFIRVFRAHQNSLEWYPMYLASMWTSALYFHQVPASVIGLVYLYGREKYFKGYSKDPKSRVQPFFLIVGCLKCFMLMSTLGVANTLCVKFLEYNMFENVMSLFLSITGTKS